LLCEDGNSSFAEFTASSALTIDRPPSKILYALSELQSALIIWKPRPVLAPVTKMTSWELIVEIVTDCCPSIWTTKERPLLYILRKPLNCTKRTKWVGIFRPWWVDNLGR
jgi:hypothetical protein